ncbi:hypothetical protein Tco_0718242 [Tanacetum coccineum]
MTSTSVGLPENKTFMGTQICQTQGHMDETIELANDLWTKKLAPTRKRQSDNKRKLMMSSRNNMVPNSNPSKGRMSPKSQHGTGERTPYEGDPCPSGNKCHRLSTTMARAPRVCHTCKQDRAHCSPIAGILDTQERCPKLKKKNGGKWECTRMVLCGWECEKKGNAPRTLMRMSTLPYGNETLTFHGNKSNYGRESRLTVISCSKAQENIGPRDPGSRSRSRAPYRLAPIRMKDNYQNNNEHSDKGIHKASFLTLGDPHDIICQKEGREGEAAVTQVFEIVNFRIPKVQFLGHVIDSKGNTMWTPGQIESQELGIIKDTNEIRPISRIKFDCGKKEENAFQLIKQKLCSAQILALPEGSEDFCWYNCDAHIKLRRYDPKGYTQKKVGTASMETLCYTAELDTLLWRLKIRDYARIPQVEIFYPPGSEKICARGKGRTSQRGHQIARQPELPRVEVRR